MPQRFTFERLVRYTPTAQPRSYYYKSMATFPNFKLAWDNALNMFVDAGQDITGCHYDPNAMNPVAEFTVIRDGAYLEEYRIRGEG